MGLSLLAVVAASLATGGAAGQDPLQWTPELSMKFRTVGNPAITADGRTLDAWLAEEGGAAGAPAKLTFLMKLLAAGSPLSIQAHPSKEQAEAGFAREERAGIPRDAGHRTYRDDNHKPELIVAVSDEFLALAGLRALRAAGELDAVSLGMCVREEDPASAELVLRLIREVGDELPPEDGLLDARLASLFDLDTLAAAIDPRRDDLMKYIGTVTMRNRYMITDRHRKTLEVPQYFWMRVAMGLALNEADPTSMALEFYEKISTLDYLPAGSTLVNAGTSYPQLSNCFVMQMEDDIEHIAKSVRDVMWLTKGTGGIGLSVTKLRSQGSPIRSNNTTSTGPIPFMRSIFSRIKTKPVTFESTARDFPRKDSMSAATSASNRS